MHYVFTMFILVLYTLYCENGCGDSYASFVDPSVLLHVHESRRHPMQQSTAVQCMQFSLISMHDKIMHASMHVHIYVQ